MEKAVAIINPILQSTKYLLLTLVFFFAAMLLGQFLLRAFDIEVAIYESLRQFIFPFLGAAIFSMLLMRFYNQKKR